uniref:Uncharacterized protein n=1 Tax=Rhizophora mucronata TaxID=61149 RepID=A0A2P2Q7U6_RHIMU
MVHLHISDKVTLMSESIFVKITPMSTLDFQGSGRNYAMSLTN